LGGGLKQNRGEQRNIKFIPNFNPKFQVRGAELEICVVVCNFMILMKLCTEIRDAHEGIWGLWVWYCFIWILI